MAFSLSFMSWLYRIFASSPFSRATIGRGVPAGASTPYQVVTSKSGRPASATVGTSGRAGRRRGRQADHYQVDRSGQHIVHRQVHALVGHVHELRAGNDVKELAGEVIGG